MKNNTRYYEQISSPVGTLTMIACENGLQALLWQGQEAIVNLTRKPDHPILLATKKQLNEYFQGKRQIFTVPLIIEGTIFQKLAWQELSRIPYGQTLSYGQQAQRLGNKNKARAVGMANNRNPISIIIPCHRVIGHDGKLVGFGGGIDKKAFLLALEKNNTIAIVKT